MAVRRIIYEIYLMAFASTNIERDQAEMLMSEPIRCATRMAQRYVKSRKVRDVNEKVLVIGAAASIAASAYGLDEEWHGYIRPSKWVLFLGVKAYARVNFLRYQRELLEDEGYDVCCEEIRPVMRFERKSPRTCKSSQKSIKRKSPSPSKSPKRSPKRASPSKSPKRSPKRTSPKK